MEQLAFPSSTLLFLLESKASGMHNPGLDAPGISLEDHI